MRRRLEAEMDHRPSEQQGFLKDRQWRETVYQGDVPQLTFRALVTGLLFGWLMALSNLYIGLKSGWAVGVELTAVILGFAVWKLLYGIRLSKKPLGMLENNIIMTTAVAPSYITSAGLVTAIPALWFFDPDFQIAWWDLCLLITAILFLGLMASIPLKRQVVNSGELRFPGAIPAAETLRSIHGGSDEGVQKAWTLGLAGLFAAITKTLAEKSVIPPMFTLPSGCKIAGITTSKLSIFFESSWIFLGFGVFLGTRVGVTMLMGMILNFAVLAPWMINIGEISHPPPQVSAGQSIAFPLIVPEGYGLAIELKDGPDTFRYVRNWEASATFHSLDELVRDLNESLQTSGPPGPSLRFIPLQVKVVSSREQYRPLPLIPLRLSRDSFEERQVLGITAPDNIHRDTRLALAAPRGGQSAASSLGFDATAEDIQNVGGYANIVVWSMWPGVALMTVAGLLAFFFQSRSLWRVLIDFIRGLAGASGRRGKLDPVADLEIPVSWFCVGFVAAGLAVIIVMRYLFQIPIWMGVIAVLISFLLAVVSIRVTGETGILPAGPMGKISQLVFGGIHPGSHLTNLMTANVTAGAATSASDLITQLKVGHLIGAKARLQFIAQIMGTLTALAVVPVFYLMVPDRSAIGTVELPAPSAVVWAGVAELLSKGLGALPASAKTALIIAGLLGAVIACLEKAYPKCKDWVFLPSPTALGLAMIIPAGYSLSLFIGSMVALLLSRLLPVLHQRYTITLASGLIAGESLVGVFFAISTAI